MSEANVPPYPASFEGLDTFRSVDQALSPSAPAVATTADDWEPITLPGTVPAAAIPVVAPPAEALLATEGDREDQLLSLIRDLNRCNDALLGRVQQLEQALESSHQALQAEVERAHYETSPEAKAAAAQRQSTAQLLSELEQANLALRRQTILAETLTAQLETSQQRVTQLERECALLQKRYNEKSQALQKSEDSCRDLRSRLQRQQRYTLQFKAALEKSLDMAATSPNGLGVPTSAVVETSYMNEGEPRSNPLAMPRADRIQPWSSDNEATPQLDPHLMALLRAESGSAIAPPPANESAIATPAPSTPVLNEADDRLWQNLERVIGHSVTPPSDAVPTAPGTEVATTTVFTEPSPWGAPKPQLEVFEVPPSAAIPSSQSDDVLQVKSSTTSSVAHPPATIEVSAQAPVEPPRPPVGDLPIFTTANGQAAPSPLVHPLRPPKKKLTSLSSVDLPSFPPLSSLKKAQ